MKALFDQKDFCDCCHHNLWYGDERYRVKYAYRAYTTEGEKILCCNCKIKYNILGRLPQKNELKASPYSMKGFSFRGE